MSLAKEQRLPDWIEIGQTVYFSLICALEAFPLNSSSKVKKLRRLLQ